MTNRSVEMRELRIPIDAVKRLSDADRYAYYMMGHMFNELICLQKLIAYALPKHDDRRAGRRKPELSQGLFLFRLASAKVWEAINTLKRPMIAELLETKVFPKIDGGRSSWEAMDAAIEAAPWLKDMRNGMGFHFPKFNQWEAYIKPQGDWVDDIIYTGAATGNTFYDGPDSLAQRWMFQQFAPVDPAENIDPLINAMIDLLKQMTNFLEAALGVFITEYLLAADAKPKKIGMVIAPDFERFALPFWTAMPSEDKARRADNAC